MEELLKLTSRYGAAVIEAYMGHVQDYAEDCVRRLIATLDEGSYTCAMDNGSEIRVRIEIDPQTRSAKVDFAGTSAQQDDNFNAPPAVVRAAVLYVLRCLIEEDIPLNDGFLRPVSLQLPEGSMLRPVYPAATAAGNVETSQVITDCLFAALGKLAASQGTMNNLTFGNKRYQYYETIAGGSGAGPDFDGTSAVQTHMTNSRLTDPEVLEWRFPVILEEFRIRQNSGGDGRHRGGDGVVRRLRALEPMNASILSNRRLTLPHGLAGGEPGLPGTNRCLRADGSEIELGANARVQLSRGDTLVLETPGGGGYGPKP
jgi:5-oxoprolinase (ATP-hydrolysing)